MERLRKLGWNSLEDRRLREDMIEMQNSEWGGWMELKPWEQVRNKNI